MPQPRIDVGFMCSLLLFRCRIEVTQAVQLWLGEDEIKRFIILALSLPETATRLTIQRAVDHLIAKDSQTNWANLASAETFY